SREPAALCRRCGYLLAFRDEHIAGHGDWWCPGCRDERPEARVITAIDIRSRGLRGTDFTLEGGRTKLRVRTELVGRFNVVNITAAAAAALTLGLAPQDLGPGVAVIAGVFGRAEPIPVRGGTAWLLLAKNPTALNEVSRFLASLRPNGTDGTTGDDVRWLD